LSELRDFYRNTNNTWIESGFSMQPMLALHRCLRPHVEAILPKDFTVGKHSCSCE
jgi:hypothetical protein